MQNLKESWLNIPEKTRKLIAVLAGGTVVIALAALLILNLGQNKEYSTLFTGLSQEEAQQVVSLLQDQGIDYRYNSNDGAIRVPQASVDQTRANLVSQGYPKSGFTYDMYLKNTGLMTTESDKEQITLYELQDRLGATIRLFDGVQDAKVTVVQEEKQRYALGDDSGQEASASVVVTMQNGNGLTTERAQAVKNLISHAVRGMNFTNVRVFDAATMLEVGGDAGGSSGTGSDLVSLTSVVENNIAANVRRVLEHLYGAGNVAVSVKGTLNMERLIQESTQYSTPEKIDQDDKNGLLQAEDVANENTGSAAQNAGGLVGADANADTPRYTNQNGDGQEEDYYSNGSASRVWLYNMLKEQRQIDPGVLEDASIGITILTSDRRITDDQLLRLVANSAGIPLDSVDDKITIIRSDPPEVEESLPPVVPVTGTDAVLAVVRGLPLPVLIAIGAAFILLILLLVLLSVRRKKKKALVLNGGGDVLEGDITELEGGVTEIDAETGLPVRTPRPMPVEEDDEFTKNEEILNLRMKRSLRLKQNISDFVDQNPQIAAKLIQSWLRGEEEVGDGRANRKHAK